MFARLFRRHPPPFDAAAMCAAFRTAAAALGKPRGLEWVSVAPTGEPEFVGDAALLPVVIRFAPVPGSDMEDVPAARDPRPAVAVFRRRRGTWQSTGRAVFNVPLARVAAELRR